MADLMPCGCTAPKISPGFTSSMCSWYPLCGLEAYFNDVWHVWHKMDLAKSEQRTWDGNQNQYSNSNKLWCAELSILAHAQMALWLVIACERTWLRTGLQHLSHVAKQVVELFLIGMLLLFDGTLNSPHQRKKPDYKLISHRLLPANNIDN